MTKEIDFYFDFISPYTYLAYKKIQSLPKNIKINYKPILLGGLHNLEGITPPAFIKPKLKHMMNDCLLISKKNNFSLVKSRCITFLANISLLSTVTDM